MMSTAPPKHRHDGTSPLPLGMDWSPPPRKWVTFSFKLRNLLNSIFTCIFYELEFDFE